MHRGFTDAEFQQTCEAVAGISLSDMFEYVYTTKELDYSTSLGYAGLTIKKESTTTHSGEKKVKFTIERLELLNPLQQSILTSWLKEKP